MRKRLVVVLFTLFASCGEDANERGETASKSKELRERAAIEVDRFVDGEAKALLRTARKLCAPGIGPEERRNHWKRARTHYERIEGAIAVLFPETDADVDGRYEHVAELEDDRNPFDGVGFIGMHAIERILWAEEIPEAVFAFERALVHYAPPQPLVKERENEFLAGLCARLMRDLEGMANALEGVILDPETAWRGLLGSIEEQVEKLRLDGAGQSESRYARYTLADMRANLEGGWAVLRAFEPEIGLLPDGKRRIEALRQGLRRLEEA
ncbi:MAG: EfeM/EfeO family lipoprotein [Deltaproteobacteria bacterium]|nr:EfeM/EfeO family lipoprotein [Deltaproteobacteria bacterium]